MRGHSEAEDDVMRKNKTSKMAAADEKGRATDTAVQQTLSDVHIAATNLISPQVKLTRPPNSDWCVGTVHHSPPLGQETTKLIASTQRRVIGEDNIFAFCQTSSSRVTRKGDATLVHDLEFFPFSIWFPDKNTTGSIDV